MTGLQATHEQVTPILTLKALLFFLTFHFLLILGVTWSHLSRVVQIQYYLKIKAIINPNNQKPMQTISFSFVGLFFG